MILIDGKHVKKKKFPFPISKPLDKAIDALITSINTDDILADCYMAELYNEINNSLHVDLTDEQAEQVRNYYIRGGMYDTD